jgi:hypothetical protein
MCFDQLGGDGEQELEAGDHRNNSVRHSGGGHGLHILATPSTYAAAGDAHAAAEGRSQSPCAAEGRQARSQTGGRQESG